MVIGEIDHSPGGARVLARFSYSRRALRCAGTAGTPLGSVERLAVVEETVVHGENGTEAQGVALAAPYGDALVERGALVGLQVGRAEEVGHLARHVEDDRQLSGRCVRVGGRVLGQAICDGGRDGAAADVVVAGEGPRWSGLRGMQCARPRSSRPERPGGVRPCSASGNIGTAVIGENDHGCPDITGSGSQPHVHMPYREVLLRMELTDAEPNSPSKF
ncbi:hypothetical protein ACFYNW_32370 [Streptomyces virginiae]|uniref:hypothetical protein n=1 Tax=Streptomyces virginiae TaxID=1961 RepID=UPI0036EEBE18